MRRAGKDGGAASAAAMRVAACAATWAAILALAACASAPPATMPAQPALLQLAQPWLPSLRATRVTTVEASGRGAMVRTYTAAGTVYTRYPEGVVSFAFVLAIDPDGERASADAFDAAQSTRYRDALQAILPEVLRAVESNNRIMYDRANPER